MEEDIDYREISDTPQGNNNSNIYYLENTQNVNQDIQENNCNNLPLYNKNHINKSEFNMKDNINYNPPEYIKVKTYHNVIQNIPENNYNYAPLFNENHMNYSEINIKNNMNYNSPNYSKVNTSQNNHGIDNKNSGKDIHENEKEISSHLNKDNQKRVNFLNANSKKEKESIIFGKNNINNTADNILSKLSRNANSIIINKKEDLNQENHSELLNQKKDISSNFNNKFDSNKIEDNINMNKKVDEEVESIDILDYNINWFRLSNEDYEDNELNEAFSEEAKMKFQILIIIIQ